MPEFIIGGIPVTFPFEPYNVQRHYMEKVIECLDKSANSVLESPTGLKFPLKKKIVNNANIEMTFSSKWQARVKRLVYYVQHWDGC